jgi:hypothetical protein
MTTIELLWFEDCPNHEGARAMIAATVADLGIRAHFAAIEVPDREAGDLVGFPGSPTIRVDGVDIEPGFVECDDCTPPLPALCHERRATRATGSGVAGWRAPAGGGRSLTDQFAEFVQVHDPGVSARRC